MTKAYLFGALHDGTERKTTFRIAQKELSYIRFLAEGIRAMGKSAWIYQEGKNRELFVVEFSKSLLENISLKSIKDKIDYIRGYFDTDGGIAKHANVRYYLYFCQKDRSDLEKVRDYLGEVGIRCGVIHNPSKKIDPYYWRFFIQAQSYEKFAQVVGSWHPVKSGYLRVKI